MFLISYFMGDICYICRYMFLLECCYKYIVVHNYVLNGLALSTARTCRVVKIWILLCVLSVLYLTSTIRWKMLGKALKALIASSQFANTISLRSDNIRINAALIIDLFKPTVRDILSFMHDIFEWQKISTWSFIFYL